MIEAVYGALAATAQVAPAAEELPEPKVPIRSSVKSDAIACLECSAKMKMLKRHLATDHGLTPAEYRKRWSLPHDYPMTAPDYSARRQALAKVIGLGRRPADQGARAAGELTAALDVG